MPAAPELSSAPALMLRLSRSSRSTISYGKLAPFLQKTIAIHRKRAVHLFISSATMDVMAAYASAANIAAVRCAGSRSGKLALELAVSGLIEWTTVRRVIGVAETMVSHLFGVTTPISLPHQEVGCAPERTAGCGHFDRASASATGTWQKSRNRMHSP
jgi:hypothetical protein